jgi:hypothetical protein
MPVNPTAAEPVGISTPVAVPAPSMLQSIIDAIMSWIK